MPVSLTEGNVSSKPDNSAALDLKKLTTLEIENKMLKEGQEDLKNDNKRLLQELAELKEKNNILKMKMIIIKSK